MQVTDGTGQTVTRLNKGYDGSQTKCCESARGGGVADEGERRLREAAYDCAAQPM